LDIERCDKCGKSFMTKAEVERHKILEHPVPVSPFEERRLADTNVGINPEDLHKLTSDVMVGEGGGNDTNDDLTTIGGGQRRKVPFRPFRI
jgi:hypothetical protein